MNKFNWKDFFKNRKDRTIKQSLKEDVEDLGIQYIPDEEFTDPDLPHWCDGPPNYNCYSQPPSGPSSQFPSFAACQAGCYDPQSVVADEKWEEQGFQQSLAGSGHAGWLYYCDGTTPYLQIKIGNGVVLGNDNTTSDGNGTSIQNAIHNHNWPGNVAAYTVQPNQVSTDITPADVIAFCYDNPTETSLGGIIDCSKTLNVAGDPPCGALWLGRWDEVGTNQLANHTQVVIGGGNIGGNYEPLDSNSNPIVNQTTGEFLQSPVTPQSHAQNNCNGTSGACDSTYYLFGCMEADQGAANYSLLQVDPSAAITLDQQNQPLPFGSWTWLYTGEGLSGGNLNINNNIIGQGTAQDQWLLAYNGGTTNPVEGCDDGTGIPNATNYDCCAYIGCNDDTTSPGPSVPANYGVHECLTVSGTPSECTSWINATTGLPTINSNYTSTSTPINWGTIAALNGGANFGCEGATANIPDSTDKSCCSYVGCPDNTLLSVIYENTNSSHNVDDPTTWVCGTPTITPAIHTHAGTRIVGCDTANMIANPNSPYLVNSVLYAANTPTGIPDPTDLTCCWNDPTPVGVTVGCTDPQATPTSYNAANDGCIPPGVGCPYQSVPDANDFSCCVYDGCNDFTDQNNTWNYGGSIAFKYKNQVASTGVFTNANGTNTDPAGNLLAIDTNTGNDAIINPLKATNGGSINDLDCNLPDFGCPKPLAANYDLNGINIDGCEGTLTKVNFYEDALFPTKPTSCCEFVGCPDNSADNYGPFDPTGPQYGNDTSAITGIWEFISQAWNWLNGTPQAFGCDTATPFNNLVDDGNKTCCEIEACTISTAVNYICKDPSWSTWCDQSGMFGIPSTLNNTIAGKGIVTSNNSLCHYGGCLDDTIITTPNVNDGNGTYTDVTHYAAANYGGLNPYNTADCATPPVVGGNDYSCCKYYGCNDHTTTPTPSVPSAYNGINPNDSNTWGLLAGTGYDGTAGECETVGGAPLPYYNQQDCINNQGIWNSLANSLVGCVSVGYTITETPGAGRTYHDMYLDPNSTWITSDTNCCTYEGCNEDTLLGHPTYNLHPYTNPSVINDYGEIGCLDETGITPFIDPNNTDCCQIEGCNQPTALNGNIDFFGCEGNASGGGVELQEDNIQCCNFIGCGDEESITFLGWNNLTSPAGVTIYGYSGAKVGCVVDTMDPTDVDANDETCCYYIGCPDVTALNTGIHANGNPNPTNNNLPDIKIDDPTSWTNTLGGTNHYCSNDGEVGGMTPGDTCCCTYLKGCNDRRATGANTMATAGSYYTVGGFGITYEAGGCEALVPQTQVCTDYINLGYEIGGDADIDVPNTNFPQWFDNGMNVDHAWEQLDSTDTSCCEYQVGCPDSGEWNPFCFNYQVINSQVNGTWYTHPIYTQNLNLPMTTPAGGPSGFAAGGYCGSSSPPLTPAWGWGEGAYVFGNVGCDDSTGAYIGTPGSPNATVDGIPDTFINASVNPGNFPATTSISDYATDFNCCNHLPCPTNHCCLGYVTPPIIPNTNLQEQTNTWSHTILPIDDVIAAGTGGWGWVDMISGNPCFCPNPWSDGTDPDWPLPSNMGGTLLVYCDTNQPIFPNHPCPLPPEAGCPPKYIKPGLPSTAPGTWNPDTCECEWIDLEIDDRTQSSDPDKCCGNIETGEIIDYGGVFPTTQQLAQDLCTNQYGPEWIEVPCDTDCNNPYEPAPQSWLPSPQEFKCGCATPIITHVITAGDLIELWNIPTIPSNYVFQANTPTTNYDPGTIGCDIVVNHTLTNLANYNPNAPNVPVPPNISIENINCCMPEFSYDNVWGCVDPNADNYALGTNAYGVVGTNPNAIGCPNSNGYPDPNNFTCCIYDTAAGCNDQRALNYDMAHVGCVPGSTITFTPPGIPPLNGPVDYCDPTTWSCCNYSNVIGCADNSVGFTNPYTGTGNITYSNYDIDHEGCDANGDGLPDVLPFCSSTPPPGDTSCCQAPVFVDPCASPYTGGNFSGYSWCNFLWDEFTSAYSNGTEMDFLNWITWSGYGDSYTHCCKGKLGVPCGFKASSVETNHMNVDVNNGTTSGYAGFGVGIGWIFPGIGAHLYADYTPYLPTYHLCHMWPDNDSDVSYPQPTPNIDKTYTWNNGIGYQHKSVINITGGPTGYCQNQDAWVHCWGGTVKTKMGQPDDEIGIDDETQDDMAPMVQPPYDPGTGIMSPDIIPIGTVDQPQYTTAQPEITPKSAEELEYERKKAEYEDSKYNLTSVGWIEGELDEERYTDEELETFEFTHLINHDNERIEFYRSIPEDEPIDKTLDGSEPIPQLPPITRDELNELVKKAIKEVKSEIRKSK